MEKVAWIIQALTTEPETAQCLVEIVRKAAVTPATLARKEEATHTCRCVVDS